MPQQYDRARTRTDRNRYVSCDGGGGGGGRTVAVGRLLLRRRPVCRQSGGRHGSRRTGFGRGCALEAHPAEHVHAMGQRASENGGQGHRQPGDRLGRRVAIDRAHRGAQRQTVAQAQQAALVPFAEARERVRRAQVSRRREHQAGQYR